MVTDARTANRNIPKPHPANTRGEEFARLITAMEMIDADLASLFIAVAARALADHGHAIADITGLQSALNNKAALSHSHALAGLSDTGGLASPTSGQVPIFLAGAWSLLSILVSPEFSGTPRGPTAALGTNTTQLATTAFVKAAIDALVNASPGQLDTLAELANALGNDANFAATMTAALGGKQPKATVLTALAALGPDLVAGDFLRATGPNAFERVAASALGMPTGSVFWFAGAAAPSGALHANGALVSRVSYSGLFAVIGTTYGAGDGSTTFALPDLRGEFIRGLDGGRGVDAGRTLGSAQGDAFQGHRHQVPLMTDSGPPSTGITSGALSGAGATGDPVTNGTSGTPRTASETRPRNVALLPCIKF